MPYGRNLDKEPSQDIRTGEKSAVLDRTQIAESAIGLESALLPSQSAGSAWDVLLIGQNAQSARAHPKRLTLCDEQPAGLEYARRVRASQNTWLCSRWL